MREYHHVLFSGDASSILLLKGKRRVNVMKALSMLSKYLGVYDEWRKIRLNHGLKWTSDQFNFNTLINSSFSKMVEDGRSIIKALEDKGHVVEFIALSGLRPAESLLTISLYHKDGENYLNKELMVLEHYKYPEIFFRKHKKAYITILDTQLLSSLERAGATSYNSIWKRLRRRGICSTLNIFRKIYSSFLRKKNVDEFMINILQGRTPSTVFEKYYLRPDFKLEIERIRAFLQELRNMLFS